MGAATQHVHTTHTSPVLLKYLVRLTSRVMRQRLQRRLQIVIIRRLKRLRLARTGHFPEQKRKILQEKPVTFPAFNFFARVQ